MPRLPPGQTLLIDADDTLWENNIYFERAIAAFTSYLNHREYSPADVRQALNASPAPSSPAFIASARSL
jgi:putative hydrolase of the HAD superfamily